MADIEGLVSGLVAHLDKVERAAGDDALIAECVSTGGPENMYDVRCRMCRWERYGGRRSELRPMAAGHVRLSHPDEAAAVGKPELLGLVRATRDLIALHVPFWPDEEPPHACSVCRYTREAPDWPCETLRIAARGWGVGDDKEDSGG